MFVYIWLSFFFGVVTFVSTKRYTKIYLQIYTNIYKIYTKYQAAAMRRQPGPARRLVFYIHPVYLVYIWIYLEFGE